MSKIGRIAVVAALAVVVGAVVLIKNQNQPGPSNRDVQAPVPAQEEQTSPHGEGSPGEDPPAAALPRLVDLGADKCIPCKVMAPILEELREEYKDKIEVVFIDVWKDPEPGRRYKIRIIPTQIFFDASGNELYRHEGFFSREEILSKWKELGISLD